ncbi:MAG: 2'-5' RNA ligase family protein [Sporichthyaceae bacterium]|nr:2'-5' RNA ligase family protein [Sporichthyaceae bacterium]
MRTRTIGVAIPIPEPHAQELQRVREGYGDPLARSIPTHVTLLAPVEVQADDLDRIEKHLRTIAESEQPFELHLRGTGTFQPVSPVVYISIGLGFDDCQRVEARVRSGPLAADPAFPYHPHVTVAHHLPGHVLRRAYEELASYDVRFGVWGFSLYEHGPDGVWRPQRDFPLGTSLPGPVLHHGSPSP